MEGVGIEGQLEEAGREVGEEENRRQGFDTAVGSGPVANSDNLDGRGEIVQRRRCGWDIQMLSSESSMTRERFLRDVREEREG